MKNTPTRTRTVEATSTDETPNVVVESDIFAVTEAVVQLSIELLAILFAILATFVLIRYIKTKYAPVSTRAT